MAYQLGDFILIGDAGVILVVEGSLFGEGGFGEGPFGGRTSSILTGADTVWTEINEP